MAVSQRPERPARSTRARPCSDHLGNRFPSQTAMLRHWNISQTVYRYRLDKKGWSLKETLETPAMDPDLAGAHECTDHLGNTFPSIRAMCDHWHVPRNVFFCRRKTGKTLAQCLNPVTRSRPGQARTIKDHTGKEHRNLDAMCAAWDITKAQYIQNIRNNLPLSRALTEHTDRPAQPKDHLGNEYPSINAMCQVWGITKTVLRSRLELGWTLKEILTRPGNESHNIPCQDHLGQKFDSLKDMLDEHGVSYTTYTHRLAKGLPLDQVLLPESLHAIKCSDHAGNDFPCLQAMIRYWFVGTGTYHHRQGKLGLNLEDSLTKVPDGWTPIPRIAVKPLKSKWFIVDEKDSRLVFTKNGLYRHLRRRAMEKFIASGDDAGGLRAVQVSTGWFRLWGGAAGPSPGIVAGPDFAWKLVCISAHTEVRHRDRDAEPKPATDGGTGN